MKSSERTIVYRLKSILLPLALIAPLLFNVIAMADEMNFNSCVKCHEDIYMKAISYKYQHSVVRDQCALCHIYPEEKDRDEVIAELNFPTLQREWLFYLDRLSENLDYQAEIIVTDSDGRKYATDLIDIALKNSWGPEGERSSFKLKKLYGATVDEIKKLGFVRAVISWNTDVFATSEIEYRLKGGRSDTFKINDLYTKDHTIILDGLKHKSRYYFQAVSRDVYGDTLKSEEYSFDTAEEFSLPSELNEDNSGPPAVTHMQVFRGPGNKGLYLKVSANKLCAILVKIKEVRGKDKKHGPGLLPARYSRIDICLKCHPHDASHPVGVKAVSPKIRTPDGLPTIEDGIITCVTCHNPHGGELAHYSWFDYRKDLCMRCHLQKYAT